MLNSNKIESLKQLIVNYIKSTEIFDENYIFTIAKNYVKENKIEITKGEIKSIIYNAINQLKNNNKIKNIDENLYLQNPIEFENNPLQQLINEIENDFLI